MKKINILLLILILIAQALFVNGAFAASPTPGADSIENQVEDLKDKIASKVAELKLVEKRGVIGTVTDTSDTQITLKDLNGNTKFVDVDELTKFSSSSSKSFGISDITKNMTLGVLGLYNKQSRRILARSVNEMTNFPKIIYGGVSAIDEDNFEITVVKENGQRVVLEVEDITKTSSYAGESLIKSGFSKIDVGQAVIAIGFPDKQDPAKILTSRLILLLDVNVKDRINLSQNQEPTMPPSTGSGKKVFPIKTN